MLATRGIAFVSLKLDTQVAEIAPQPARHLQFCITDPQALRHVLVTGIGRSKAYGCGLLTLARVRRG